MDAIVARAESILRRHPAPALPLSTLLGRLQREGPDPFLDAARLRHLLEGHPERFRILELHRGALRYALDARAGEREGTDPWVAVVTDPADQETGERRRDLATLRESVRWLVRHVDGRSTREVAHWHRLALSAEEARAALRRAG